jgi:hypothetical protein
MKWQHRHGPKPIFRFQNDERVMEENFRHLPSVERVSVISDFFDLLRDVVHFILQEFPQLIIGHDAICISWWFCQIHVRIEIELLVAVITRR